MQLVILVDDFSGCGFFMPPAVPMANLRVAGDSERELCRHEEMESDP